MDERTEGTEGSTKRTSIKMFLRGDLDGVSGRSKVVVAASGIMAFVKGKARQDMAWLVDKYHLTHGKSQQMDTGFSA